MGRKKGKKNNPSADGATPRRGLRRSIRYEAVDDFGEESPPQRGPDAPPTIHLRMISAEEALGRLQTQLRAYQRQGKSEVLVVHGKGQNSAGGVSVLGPLVRQWCDDNPAVVAGWREAPNHWGGSGAIVVVLN